MKRLINDIKAVVNAPRNDGMLHFSSHLQHDRHTCVFWKHGYPEDKWNKPWMNTFPLLQGTAIHEELHRIMQSYHTPYASEIQILKKDTKYPWTGTIDAYTEDDNGNVVLIDYKTISGTSYGFLDGPKPEHIMQVSAYYHYGMPNVHSVGILYLPTTPDYKRRWHEPTYFEVTPLSKEVVDNRIAQVEEYIDVYMSDHWLPAWPAGERYWKENKRDRQFEWWYKPHYSTMYCPWKDSIYDPCGCNEDKAERLGIVDRNGNVLEGDEELVSEAYAAFVESV